MPDIVERLRSRSPYLHGSSAERTMAEAAAEIERLLDALKAIECHSIDHTDACRMAGKARAALEPKP